MPAAPHRLATIYEIDEELLLDAHVPNLLVSSSRQARLPYHICWSIIAGCFFLITFVIAISFNPFYAWKITDARMDVVLGKTSNGSLNLSTQLIHYLDDYSRQFNEELNLQSDTIATFLTSMSNSSSETPLLWIYFHLKYPPSCATNARCKENLQSKLNLSFKDLADLVADIEFDAHPNESVELISCRSIENPTTTTLVARVTIEPIEQHDEGIIETIDSSHCDAFDHTALLPMIIEHTKGHGSMKPVPISTVWENSTYSHRITQANDPTCFSPPLSKIVAHRAEQGIPCPTESITRWFFMRNSY